MTLSHQYGRQLALVQADPFAIPFVEVRAVDTCDRLLELFSLPGPFTPSERDEFDALTRDGDA